MIIRKCTEMETAAVGALYDRVVRWLDEHINYPKWKYRIYPSEDFALEMTRQGDQYICLENGRIIGAFVLNADPMGNYRKVAWSQELSEGEYLVLHTLAIDPEVSGHGRATEVIRFCIDLAKGDGYKALRLDMVPGNLPAQRLYEKNGFNYVGDEDLERGVADVPYFSMYELDL